MADIKFSEFPKATISKDSDEIAILQDGVNKMIASPVLESKIINKTVSRVIDQGGASLNVINLKGVVPTYADLATITPTPQINDAYQVEADGLVYVYTDSGFQDDGDGFVVQAEPTGVVEEGNTQSVSGGEVANVFIQAVGTEILESGEVDYIDFLKGLSRTDFSESSPWRQGYINTLGSISVSSSYIYTKDYIKLAKGKYRTNIAIENNTVIFATYDANRNFKQWFGTKGSTNALVYWDFELLEDGYFRFSQPMYYDTNPSIVKLEGRGLFDTENKYVPTDNVYVLKDKLKDDVYDSLDIESTPINTNFIDSLVDSDINDTSIWMPRYLGDNGGTFVSANFYHTVNYYKIPKGSYEFRLFFSNNAKALLYDPNTYEITKVISKLGDNTIELVEVENDSLLRFSHRIVSPSETKTDLIYWRNLEDIYPKVITAENISDFSSNNSLQKAIKDSHFPRMKRKIVSFISDDGYASEFDWFCPLLEEYGIKATLAIVKDWVGNESVGNMLTESQIIELDRKGHEIASHTSNHGHLNAITSSDAHQIISFNKTYLEDLLNKPCTTFVSPFGESNKTTDNVFVSEIVSAYHECNVITGYGYLNPPPVYSYFLKRESFDLGAGETERFPSILQPIIESSALNNNWLMFAFHTARGEYRSSGTRRQELRNMIEFLILNGYEFMTVKNAMNYMKNPVEIGVRGATPQYYQLGMDGSEINVGYFED